LPSAGTLSLEIQENDDQGTTLTGSVSNLGVILNDGSRVLLSNTGSANTGAIYSKNEIDSLLNGLNGMTYKGTLGGAGADLQALPTTGVKSGDTYVIVEDDFTLNSSILNALR